MRNSRTCYGKRVNKAQWGCLAANWSDLYTEAGQTNRGWTEKHEREGNKSQIFIRAGLLKLESAFKLCGQFIRMQILTQEVWGGISFCTSKGVPRWRPRGHDRRLGSEALNLFLDSKLSSSFQKNNPVSDPQREA